MNAFNRRPISAKLRNMRKAQEFTVYPRSAGESTVTVQSDKSIGQFDPATGKGVLNTKGSYFPHLYRVMGAQPYQFPAEFVAACTGEIPQSGEAIIPGLLYVA